MGAYDYGAHRKEEHERDVPLAVGTVTSRRWFSVDTFGHLVSPFQHEVWPSYKDKQPWYYATCGANYNDPNGMRTEPWPKAGGRSRWGFDHVVGAYHCSCGIYSYFHEPHESVLLGWDDTGHYIGAIIENTGRMTYGDKGLRSQRARIVALVTNYEPPASFRGFFRFWGDLIGVMAAVLLLGIMTLLNIGLFYLLTIWFDEATVLGYQMWAMALAYPMLLVAFYVRCADSHWMYGATRDQERFNKLQQNYPGIPIYGTWREAQRHHPVTKRKDLP